MCSGGGVGGDGGDDAEPGTGSGEGYEAFQMARVVRDTAAGKQYLDGVRCS
eukprot:NODE_4056_length_715_cov_221.703030.p5 GENE.NODE_4056_length_715_cov_221.703030~~NODE_4056_length_715_cov_221.703030.p5  ORF type:complete len:51 (-),score=15.37 NODE_4056_length_715_cov_221.703030:437-589(-)